MEGVYALITVVTIFSYIFHLSFHDSDTVVSPPAVGLDEDEVAIAFKRIGKEQTEKEETRTEGIENEGNREDETEKGETRKEEKKREETRKEETENEETRQGGPENEETGKKGSKNREARKEGTTNEEAGNQDTEKAAAPRGFVQKSLRSSNITGINLLVILIENDGKKLFSFAFLR